MHCPSQQNDPKVRRPRRTRPHTCVQHQRESRKGSTRRVDQSIQAHMSESRCAR